MFRILQLWHSLLGYQHSFDLFVSLFTEIHETKRRATLQERNRAWRDVIKALDNKLKIE